MGHTEINLVVTGTLEACTISAVFAKGTTGGVYYTLGAENVPGTLPQMTA